MSWDWKFWEKKSKPAAGEQPRQGLAGEKFLQKLGKTGARVNLYDDPDCGFKGTRIGKQFDTALEGAIKTFDQQDTQLNDHHIAETADGSQTVNVTNRNVATSRLADLLGVGDLVARSEKVELQDAEGGGKRTGNLMQAGVRSAEGYPGGSGERPGQRPVSEKHSGLE